MNKLSSPLRQEREKRGWSRPKIEELTRGRLTVPSLERWEEGKAWPRSDSIEALCKLYDKSAEELGLDRGSGIMMLGNNAVVTKKQGNSGIIIGIPEGTTMSDSLKSSFFVDLSSRLN